MTDVAKRLRDYAVNGSRPWIGIAAVFDEAADALTALQKRVQELEDDIRIWKREATDRSEGMVQLNLDRAAMGVENSQLREKLDEAARALRGFFPTNIALASHLPDDAVIPLDVTMAELRAASIALAKIGGSDA
ncbi:MAG: hypothetical protein QM690_17195 [Sphingobium sp.]